MKKQLLFVCTLALGFGMNAQTNKLLLREAKAIKPQDDANSFVNQVAMQNAASNKTSAIVNNVLAGNQANAYGSTFARRAPLSTMPSLNLVGLVHRVNVTNTPAATNSGNFAQGFSSNSGTTWTKNLGPVYLPVTLAGAPAPGRYPTAAIFNPSGNTSATGAYAYYAGPALVGGVFGGMVYGSYQIGAATGNSGGFAQDALNNVFTGFPYGIAVNAAGEALIPVIVTTDLNSTTAPYVNPNSVKLHKLTGATTATTSISTINMPPIVLTNDAMARIAFAPNGTTGFVSLQGDDSATAALPGNDRLRMYISKTTDGGATWSAWNKIDFNGMSGLDSLFDIETAPFDSTDFTTDFQHDLTVDALGNPHIVVGVSKANKFTVANYSCPTAPELRAQFVLSSANGGTTFSAKFLQRLNFLRSTIGAVGTDNNHTASRNAAGTLMTFGCLNVDGSNGFDTSAIPAADWYLTSYSPTNGWSATVNVINGSALEGQIDAGQGANFTLNNGEYPLMYTEFGLDAVTGAKSDVLPATIQYVTGATIPLALTKYKSNIEVVKLFPNPSNGSLTLKVGSAAKNVSLEIINLVGQSVFASKMPIGTNKVDLTSLNKGIYFANINVDGVKSTQKLVIE